jgi:hypothetical protein
VSYSRTATFNGKSGDPVRRRNLGQYALFAVASERDAGFVRLAIFELSQHDENCPTGSVSHCKYRSASGPLSQLIPPSGHRRLIRNEGERDICGPAMILRGNVSYRWTSDSCCHQNTCQNAFHIQSPLFSFLRAWLISLSSDTAGRRVKNSNRDPNFFAGL